MKIKLVEDPESELEVQITYPKLDQEVRRLIDTLNNMDQKIRATNDKGSRLLMVKEIYYVESVDRKTFLYTEDQVYRCSKKVYQLAEEWEKYGFVQIGKATLVNMDALIQVRTLWNSKLEGTLKNNEKIIISRTYIKQVKRWLAKEADTN